MKSICIGLFALGVLGCAQESVNYASISGRVTDPSGSAVQGAEVKARQLSTNLANTAITDNEGRFRFSYLKVGEYQVTIHKDGFADAAMDMLTGIV